MRKVSGCLSVIVGLWAAGSAAAVEYCPALMQAATIRPRGLYAVEGGRPLPVEDAALPKTGPMQLAYVVPNYEFDSGALIVKFQHRVAGATSADRVSLERDKYVSPCSNVPFPAFSSARSVAEYRNYHRYFAADFVDDPARNLDAFHADVGARPAPIFYNAARTTCLTTRSRSVRAQALFEDDRRPATIREQLAWQYGAVRAALPGGAAAAMPAGYREYQTLTTRIIPYRKDARAHLCVMIKFDVPLEAITTSVSIVDADEAHGRYAARGVDDGQDQWDVNWSSGRVSKRNLNVR